MVFTGACGLPRHVVSTLTPINMRLNSIKVRFRGPSDVQAVSGFYQELASNGIDPRLCAKKEHLHITICMLKLYSNHQLQLAKNVLAKHSEAIRAAASHAPLLIELAGLEIMNGNLAP